MKRLALSFLVLVSAVAIAGEPQSVTIAGLLEKPDTYSGKEVKAVGKVEKFQQKTSKIGNPYFTFKLLDKDKKTVNIYGKGKLDPPLKDGVTVEVTGTFTKEKVVSGITFKNEIETAPKYVKKS
jgi:hypothetical protein